MIFLLCFLRDYTVSRDYPLIWPNKRFEHLPTCYSKASIDKDRESALLELSSRFDSILARFLRDGYIEEGYEQSMHHPYVSKAGHFFQRLYFLNIWPISTRLRTLNLDFIQRAIVEFEEPEFKKQLITEIVRAVEWQKGLCLWCVRKGKISSHEGNCVRLCGFHILSSGPGLES